MSHFQQKATRVAVPPNSDGGPARHDAVQTKPEYVSSSTMAYCASSPERVNLGLETAILHDRDSKFTRAFDDVFQSEGIEIIRTPFRAPNANAFAERWVGTVRRDCLDWLLIASRRQLERVLRVYVEHYNTHRPHRALGLRPPAPTPRLHLADASPPNQIQRRERLGGLINEYARAA